MTYRFRNRTQYPQQVNLISGKPSITVLSGGFIDIDEMDLYREEFERLVFFFEIFRLESEKKAERIVIPIRSEKIQDSKNDTEVS
jgi:hypothetical protein